MSVLDSLPDSPINEDYLDTLNDTAREGLVFNPGSITEHGITSILVANESENTVTVLGYSPAAGGWEEVEIFDGDEITPDELKEVVNEIDERVVEEVNS